MTLGCWTRSESLNCQWILLIGITPPLPWPPPQKKKYSSPTLEKFVGLKRDTFDLRNCLDYIRDEIHQVSQFSLLPEILHWRRKCFNHLLSWVNLGPEVLKFYQKDWTISPNQDSSFTIWRDQIDALEKNSSLVKIRGQFYKSFYTLKQIYKCILKHKKLYINTIFFDYFVTTLHLIIVLVLL